MANAAITIYGEESYTRGPVEAEEEVQLATDGIDRIHVSLPGEVRTNEGDQDAPEWRCSECNDGLFGDGDGFSSFMEEPCTETDDGAHVPQRVPLSWPNSVWVDFDEKEDRISIGISVGDPRGAFVFSVYRMEDGTYRVSTPYPGEGMPHMELRQLNNGFYATS